ncbi:MAG: cobalt ABC transporter ATP-binding protein [Firmicutes bacterium HGW-Firmicutes-11]|nr:MAG: cobalt ABC transporter ATP-binding protein [Firmicutes bacterium HGW-Firmicutes-11]
MATFEIKNLGFTYPKKAEPALSEIDLTVEYGEFVVLCGQTGCGKSTLLRNLKTVLTPYGKIDGEVRFYGTPLSEISQREQASRIGYVLQDPDNQLVTDKVWHELAFGLENLGYDQDTIRLRTAEMASFFGIQEWFHKNVDQLSGGQKQLLNLAAVMAMQPDVLILDEPTSQLDPIAAADFLETIRRINLEIGTTVILSEHRLEEVLVMADRVVVLDKGKVIVNAPPAMVGSALAKADHPMLAAMPTPMQVYERLGLRDGEEKGPLTVREGRNWLTGLFSDREMKTNRLPRTEWELEKEPSAIRMKDVWFRYEKNEKDVIKGLTLSVPIGKISCVVGGNGTGKTTALMIIGGLRKPYRGNVDIGGASLAILPQNPQSLFLEKTVHLDLLELLDRKDMSDEEKEEEVRRVAKLVGIESFFESHPYDLSGGEQQLVALAKILLLDPDILLLDEPTKGIDSHGKERLAGILKRLAEKGKTILLVSHDIEFCGKYGDRCSMFFDGSVVTTGTPDRFFSGNSFYTTAANRMSRHIFENAVTTTDVIALCRANLEGETEGA